MSYTLQVKRFALHCLKKIHCRLLAPSTLIMRCWRSVPDIRQFISPAVAWQVRWGCPISVFLPLMDVLTDIRRITDVCSLPLLVDADIGFGSSAFNVAR